MTEPESGGGAPRDHIERRVDRLEAEEGVAVRVETLRRPDGTAPAG